MDKRYYIGSETVRQELQTGKMPTPAFRLKTYDEAIAEAKARLAKNPGLSGILISSPSFIVKRGDIPIVVESV